VPCDSRGVIFPLCTAPFPEHACIAVRCARVPWSKNWSWDTTVGHRKLVAPCQTRGGRCASRILTPVFQDEDVELSPGYEDSVRKLNERAREHEVTDVLPCELRVHLPATRAYMRDTGRTVPDTPPSVRLRDNSSSLSVPPHMAVYS
jgi:hypothetical protein